jgi:hypothetical protein
MLIFCVLLPGSVDRWECSQAVNGVMSESYMACQCCECIYSVVCCISEHLALALRHKYITGIRPVKAGGAAISDEGFSLTACKQGLSVLLKMAGAAAPILDIHDLTR